MRLSLIAVAVAVAAFVAAAHAAVVEPPKNDANNANPVGPVSPDHDPATSVAESIRRMKLSIDRELVYLARMEEVSRTRDLRGMVVRQQQSVNGGFTNRANDGSKQFKPILPGSDVPTERQIADMTTEPEPEVDPTADPTPSTPVTTVAPSATVAEPSEAPEPVPTFVATVMPSVAPAEVEGPSVVPLPTEMPSFDATPMPVTPTFVPEEAVFTPVPEEEIPVTMAPTPVPFVTEEPVFTEPPTPEPTPMEMTPVPVPEVVATPEVSMTPEPVATPVAVTPVPVEEEDLETSSTPEESLEESAEDDLTDEDDASEEAATETADDDSVCFPASATVTMADGSVKPMRAIALGDRVRVSADASSPVFMFTHKMASVRYPFVQLSTESNNTLSLTRGHYLYVNGRLAAASTVQLGDELQLADMTTSRVVNVEQKMDTGLYNPQTVQGDLIVDGVRVSTYTTAVAPKAAHAFLMPLRAAFEAVGFSLTAFDSGADTLSKVVPKGTLVL